MSRLARRDFLKTGSAVVAGAALAGLLPERLFAANADAAVLSVGFAELPAVGESARLGAAERVLAGDPAFISRGARVGVGSYRRAAKYDGRPGKQALAAIFPAFGYEPARYPRFNAWSFPGAAAVRFTMPVTAADGLQLAVRDANESRLALTLASRSDALKLARGVYVIALRESSSDAVPSWSGLTLRRTADGFVVDTAAFSYIVVSVDYAN